MADVTITGWRRENGAGCEHVRIQATVLGREIELRSSLSEIQALATDGAEVRQAILVIAGLRRRAGRAIEGDVT